MNIALIADNEKKELLVQFCTAYSGILAKHDLCATATTAKLVAEGTGLPVTAFMPGGQGGVEQISALISCDQIDMLLYFRGAVSSEEKINGAEINLMRLCDLHTVPMATNIATAEVLIHGLANGWLDWRDIVNPKQ